VNFISWDQLTPVQQSLLAPFQFPGASASDLPTAFAQWAASHDDQAAEFLAMTRALDHLDIFVDGVNPVVATSLLVRLTEIEGDRIHPLLDTAAFDQWRSNGARFVLHFANGKERDGNFRFDRGPADGDFGGSLHDGSDIQGYTSVRDMARIQINYSIQSGIADIDMDLAPWIWGFIPNPWHMTYAGSDSRQWLGTYLNKYGDPGFQVRKHYVDGN
jgi:hypothetical protein